MLNIVFDSTDYALMILQIAIVSYLRFLDLNIDDTSILYLLPGLVVMARFLLITGLGSIQAIIQLLREGVR